MKPQYRLRVDELRIFYDVEQHEVIVLGIVEKAHTEEWLSQTGEHA